MKRTIRTVAIQFLALHVAGGLLALAFLAGQLVLVAVAAVG